MKTQDFDAVARTALLTTALRTRETARLDRLYADPYAEALAGAVGRNLFDEVARITGAHRPTVAPDGRKLPNTFDYNAIRTRFFDDWLATRLAEGHDQVVIGAAGMDTRAYRLTWPRAVTVYEVDRPAVLGYKRAALAGVELAGNVERKLVGADLAADGWRPALAAAGFDFGRSSVWLLEGLLYYLDGDAVRRLLAGLGEACAPGTHLACDLVNEVALSAPSTRPLLRLFADWGSPWLFGSDEPERMFASYGFDVAAVQPGERGAHYGRWQDTVIARDVPGVPRVFYVHGRRS
ncbi:SAM-dependent methyltransferase [Amycolatopsis sp. NPDC059021]|uniref:SAM-dependent methyltransferase n=1 Tax=Amycolatopsis sp. NPDC059021 TaxID=3346704 RepID=UPI003672A6CF